MECNRIDSAGAAGDLDDELLVVVLNLLSFPSISSKRDPLPNIWYQIPVPVSVEPLRCDPPDPGDQAPPTDSQSAAATLKRRSAVLAPSSTQGFFAPLRVGSSGY